MNSRYADLADLLVQGGTVVGGGAAFGAGAGAALAGLAKLAGAHDVKTARWAEVGSQVGGGAGVITLIFRALGLATR